MNVKVLFFASLKEHLGQADIQLEVPPSQTVAALWQVLSADVDAVPEQILVAVNQEYVQANYQLKNGDEVAFFPPVTGG